MKARGVLLFAVLALVIAGATPAIAQECPRGAKIAPHPNPKPVSWWVIKGISAEWVARIELKRVEGDKFIAEINGREVVYTNEWNTIDDAWDHRTIRTKYSPHVRNFSFPLCTGKKWGGLVEWTGRTMLMTSGTYSEWGEAKQWEQITVPAGTFDAIGIELLSNGIQRSCWHAPEAHRTIKCTSSTHPRYGWQLIEFHLAGEDGGTPQVKEGNK